ncbi:MAG: WecB/TagA/CpsF family glycosyltransferase, partial [Peptoniphilus sp.]|nr:WecB/TagA/CpsF family glycosyltransferase [Peptoniphilus sp.]
RIERDTYFKKICDSCELLLVDGHPLLWIAKFYKRPFKQKICGSDLVPVLCELAAQKGYSVFFLGAAEGVAEIAANNMCRQYSGLKVAGTYSPPFGFENDESEIKHIITVLKESNADMLFVGMGVPKQDIFVYENMDKYKIPVSFSIGGTIDFIAGKQKRAPGWIRKIGFEWLYRLVKDPKRMFKRYIIDDIKIIKLVFKYRRVSSDC